MTNAILTQLEYIGTWVGLVLIIAFILGSIWAVVDAACGWAAARIVHSGNVVSIEERRRQLKAASEAVR
jgi:hypothetical protein